MDICVSFTLCSRYEEKYILFLTCCTNEVEGIIMHVEISLAMALV